MAKNDEIVDKVKKICHAISKSELISGVACLYFLLPDDIDPDRCEKCLIELGYQKIHNRYWCLKDYVEGKWVMKCIGCNEMKGVDSVKLTVFRKVIEERKRQALYKEVNDMMSSHQMLTVLTEEVGEIAKELNDEIVNQFKNDKSYPQMSEMTDRQLKEHDTHAEIISAHAKNRLKEELYQVAAVAFQWLERIELGEGNPR